jgi:uncharacterized protein (DUF1684 family)
MKAYSLIIAGSLALAGCGTPKPSLPVLSAADSIAIVDDNIAHRAKVDAFFRNDPGSPFHRDTTVEFHGIRWFPVDPRYAGRSVLHRYENPDTVVIMGTKGEERHELRYGYFEFSAPDSQGALHVIRLNVYKFTPYDGQRYLLFKDVLSVWFTDSTTGHDTYDVGRYLEIGAEQTDPSFVYPVDLNKAYNPYCAYSPKYSCAVPSKDDHVALALRVGEKKYHE